MLNKLIAFSLKNRMFVVIAALLVSMTGSYLASQMPIDVLPNFEQADCGHYDRGPCDGAGGCRATGDLAT